AMQGGPLERRLLEAGSAEEQEEETHWRACPKRGMREQTVIADGNRKSRRQHIKAEERPFGCCNRMRGDVPRRPHEGYHMDHPQKSNASPAEGYDQKLWIRAEAAYPG